MVEICIAVVNMVAGRVLIRAICFSALATSDTSFQGRMPVSAAPNRVRPS
jgi:hypothetical protein